MKPPKIIQGMEHRLFFTILRDTLQQGPSHICATQKRIKWKSENSHQFPEALLVLYLAYLEGMLGSGWIENYGEKQKRELYALRLSRNAIVHSNGNLKLSQKPKKPNARKGRPKDPCQYVRRFASDLRTGIVSKVQNGKVPNYLSVDRKGIVKLNSSGFGRLSALATIVLNRANFILTN